MISPRGGSAGPVGQSDRRGGRRSLLASDDGKIGLWLGNLEDLWKFGPPRGEGGPWRDADVRAGEPSDPYLMIGYENKKVQLSHDRATAVRFTLEVDFLANGTWHTYQTVTVSLGETVTHVFPPAFGPLGSRQDRPRRQGDRLVPLQHAGAITGRMKQIGTQGDF